MKKVLFVPAMALFALVYFASCKPVVVTPVEPVTPTELIAPSTPEEPTVPTVPDTPAVTFTVIFDSDGGSDVESQTVTSGDTATIPNEPTKTAERTSYAFLGWYNGNDRYDFSSEVNAEITLKAKWLEGFVKVEGSTVIGSDKFITAGQTDNKYKGAFVDGRTVEIHDMFVCEHEVTQGEYETYCKYGPYYSPSDTYGKGENFPTYYVSWYDAVVYCNLRTIDELGIEHCVYSLNGEKNPANWAGIVGDAETKYCGPTSTKSTWDYKGEEDADGGIIADFTAKGYRLPTDAEWEYAARGGKTGVESENPNDFAGTDSYGQLGTYSWYYSNSNGKTHEVKTKTDNGIGLYDMSGNVFEYCWDWYVASLPNDTPASGPSSGSYRVNRGACFRSGEDGLFDWNPIALRAEVESRSVMFDRGFRVVRTAE